VILLCGPRLLLGRPYYEPLLWFMIVQSINKQYKQHWRRLFLAHNASMAKYRYQPGISQFPVKMYWYLIGW